MDMQNEAKKKFVAYYRVSSKRQKEEGVSLEAQRKLIKEYALRNNFMLVEEYEVDESASKPDRTTFTSMLQKVKENKDIEGIICEKVDRLLRGHLKDRVFMEELVEEYDKQLHFVKQSLILDKDSKYSLGSFLNFVLLHQSIVGLEAKKQMEKAHHYPDTIIGCCGGGSNFGGLIAPFIADKLMNNNKTRFIGVEPLSCPTMTKGEYKYDFGDTAKMTPLLKMMTLGHAFIPSPIHAGGLRYHGMSPIISFLQQQGIIEPRAYDQQVVFQAGIDFARCEGIIPAPESSHAIKATIDEALQAKKENKKKVILFNLSGHGLLDLNGYDKFLHHQL